MEYKDPPQSLVNNVLNMIKFKEDIGKIYDVINYGVIYFNKPAFIKMLNITNIETDNALDFFYEVKNNCNPLMDGISPFFYYDSYRSCFLSEYFSQNINFQTDNFNNFIDILQDIPKLRKAFVNYIFVNSSENEKSIIINDNDNLAIYNFLNSDSFPYDEKMKTHIMFILYNFDFIVKHLLINLKEIYKHIKTLHENHKDKINDKIEEIVSKECLNLFEKAFDSNQSIINKQTYSMCLINQYVILYEGKYSFYLLGYRYNEKLEIICNKKDVKIDHSLTALGNDIRLDIINCLKENKKLTLTKISDLINTSKSNVSIHIDILFTEGVIKVSHKEGAKRFYMLNKDYLYKFEDTVIKFIGELKNS